MSADVESDAPANIPENRGSASVTVRRTDVELRPDPRRVIVKPFLPSDQILPNEGLLARILALPEEDVAGFLTVARVKFEDRHLDLGAVLDSHFQFVARGAHELSDLSKERHLLIGAYHTQEFSIETAALTNPSIVAHPDQDGLDLDGW